MKLQFFSSGFVSRLREGAAVNQPKYAGDQSWLDALSGGKAYAYESSQIVDPPPKLLITAGDNAPNDAENAKRVYTWLSKLTPALAMEERLWAHMTHVVFADYMKSRWPADSASAIQRRYLFEGKSFAALCRNGIARLWWAGSLTRDEKRENPFQLTEVLFHRQDIQVSLLERSLGKCGKVRIAVLDFLLENSGWLASESFGRRIQLLLKEINLLGGVAILDALPESELRAFMKKVGENLTKS